MVHEYLIHANSQVIDMLVMLPCQPFGLRNEKAGKPLPNVHLDINIADIVFLEQLPLFRCITRKIAGTATVGLGRSARLAEILNQLLALSHLLLVQSQCGTSSGQRTRQTEIRGQHHGTAPLLRRHWRLEPASQTGTLKCCVVRSLEHIRVKQ